MPLIDRPDGTPVSPLSPMRKLIPHLMPSRNGSAVYFEQHVDVTDTLTYIERRRADDPDLNLFQVVLTALVRTLARRPQMHRFVAGRRLYQRHVIELSFAVKKQMSDQGQLTVVKVAFDPQETLDGCAARIRAAVKEGKGQRATTSEREMSVVTRLPRAVLRVVMGAQRTLDYFNLLPASMVATDPMYASMFVANLGSIGLDAAFHHLYEYGTVPIFATVGRVRRTPAVTADGTVAARDVMVVRFTFDERIADGLYAARSLEIFKQLVEQPACLERPDTPLDGATASP
jgi:hypothetical protein